MKQIRAWVRRVAGVFRTTRRDAELAAEIESHLQLHTDENIRRGMSPEAARRDAVLKLGSMVVVTEEYRDRRGLPLLEQFLQDLRYAGRTMRRSPGVTVVAAITLALGVAGPTVMFAMMKAWILDPLPFPRPETLVDIRMLDTTTGRARALNAADFLDLTRSARSFDSLAAYRAEEFRLTGPDRADRLSGARVTVDFFRALGTQPALGRVFGPVDRVSGNDHVVVPRAGNSGTTASTVTRASSVEQSTSTASFIPSSACSRRGSISRSSGASLCGRRSSSLRSKRPTGGHAPSWASAGSVTARPSPRPAPSCDRSPTAWPGSSLTPTPADPCACGGWQTRCAGITTSGSSSRCSSRWCAACCWSPV